MELSSITFLQEQFIKAIGATLIHSIWQGIVLAALTGLIITFTKTSRSTVRYNLLVSAMLLFFVAASVTFYIEIIHFKDIAGHLNQITKIANAPQNNLNALSQDISVIDQVKNYLFLHSDFLVLIWFLLVVFQGFRLFIGLNRLNYLRHKTIFPVVEEWQTKVSLLAHQLKIKQVVAIAESGLTKVPLVIGHFKPLILIPIGLLTALPAAEIEAIIIHELAHIYRRDYLINILQSLVEILFFFNPAILWLSALIQQEREHCCDDIAIEQTSSKVDYIRALVSCQEHQLNTPDFAMAFNKNGQLKSRVKRLVYNNNHTLNRVEKLMLVICIAVMGLGLFAFSNSKNIDLILVKTSRVVKNLATDVKNKIKAPPVDKKAITSVTALTAKVISNSGTTEKSILKKEEKSTARASLAKPDSIEHRLSPLNDTIKRIENRLPVMAGIVPVAPVKPAYAAIANRKESIGDQVKEDLVKDGLIKRTDDTLSFKLSEKELIVNGRKIEDEIYKKYRSKYVPYVGKNSWTFYHNYDTSTKINVTVST